MSWTLQELEQCCGQANKDSNAIDGLAVKLSNFVESTPNDFLEALIKSPFGRVYQHFLERCCNDDKTSQICVEKRNLLSQQLKHSGFGGADGQRFLLAIMPFYPKGSMRVDNAKDKLPEWLFSIYAKRYDDSNEYEDTEQQIGGSSGTSGLTDRIFLNRLLGLSNLYYIDPDDKEITDDLRKIRIECINFMLNTSNNEFAEYFSGDFGDRYWALAQCGVQKEDLGNVEIAKRDEIQKWLTQTPNSLSQEGGIQRFAAALLFSAPGTVQLANPERNLPAWFVDGFKRFSSMAVA